MLMTTFELGDHVYHPEYMYGRVVDIRPCSGSCVVVAFDTPGLEQHLERRVPPAELVPANYDVQRWLRLLDWLGVGTASIEVQQHAMTVYMDTLNDHECLLIFNWLTENIKEANA
jgi:hypothetical protein